MTAREIAALVPWSWILEEAGTSPGRSSRARCPIHKGNNTTSFSFSDERSYAKCFACGWRGDKPAFLQAVLGVDFKTALARIADLAGVRLSYCKPDRSEQRHIRAHRTALEVARDNYKAWCRDRWRLLCEFNGELLEEKLDADEALRLTEKFPNLLTP